MTTVKIITADPPRSAEFLKPIKMIENLFYFRELIVQFTWREVIGRYKGTYLGLVWSLLKPLMTLAVYTFIFGFILKARFATVGGVGHGQYALTLFCGIIVYNIFSGCISRAPLVIFGNPNYVKNVVFPLEILPVSTLGSSIVQAGLSLAILIPALLIFSPKISSTVYMFPLILLPLCALTLGFGWFLASLGVFVRDIGQAITVLLQLLFFMSPILYPLSSVPKTFQFLARLNPLATIIENAKRTLIWGQPLEWGWWLCVTLASLILMQLGYLWFMRTKRKFADFI